MPYLPSNISNKKYTLVLDLDETLVCFQEVRIYQYLFFYQFEFENGEFLIRPYAEAFLLGIFIKSKYINIFLKNYQNFMKL